MTGLGASISLENKKDRMALKLEKSSNLLPSGDQVNMHSRENSQVRLLEPNKINPDVEDFMRQTISRDLGNGSSFAKNDKIEAANPGMARIKSPELPMGSDSYSGQPNLRLSIQSPTAANGAGIQLGRIDNQNNLNPASTNSRDLGVRGSSTLMSNAFNIMMKKP